jgi:hypothetical protein
MLVYNIQLKSESSQSFINYQHVRDSHFVNFHLPKRCIIFKDLTIRNMKVASNNISVAPTSQGRNTAILV